MCRYLALILTAIPSLFPISPSSLTSVIGITLNARARLLPANDARLGTVSYIGPIPQILGSLGAWIGITLDEPTGKNDGSIPSKGKEGEDGFIEGARYFQCLPKCGVFVRPERVEIGDFPAADDFGEEMEEM